MTQLALNMPFVFVAIYGLIVCVAPQWRFTAFIIVLTASANILLADFFWTIADAVSPLITTFAFYSLIDILTVTALSYARPFMYKGVAFGMRGAKGQAKMIALFVGFNLVAYCDYAFHEYVLHSEDYYLKSVYIPVIFVLNIMQILRLGIDRYGRNIRRRLAHYLESRNGKFGYTYMWSLVAEKKHRQVAR